MTGGRQDAAKMKDDKLIGGIMKKVKRLFGTLRKNFEWGANKMYCMPFGK